MDTNELFRRIRFYIYFLGGFLGIELPLAAAGFFWAAALGGYGIQSAPAFGRLCAALLHGEGVPAELASQGVRTAPLAPRRVQPVVTPPTPTP